MLVISICIVGLTFYSDPTKEHTRIALISFKSNWYDGKVKKKKPKKKTVDSFKILLKNWHITFCFVRY